jgi:hypothetical protein
MRYAQIPGNDPLVRIIPYYPTPKFKKYPGISLGFYNVITYYVRNYSIYGSPAWIF